MVSQNLKVGDKVQRLYTYEIRMGSKGRLYAHILDGSGYHLNIHDIGNDFKLIE